MIRRIRAALQSRDWRAASAAPGTSVPSRGTSPEASHYLSGRRGDRLHPPWWHPRYAVLKLLAVRLRQVVDANLPSGPLSVLDYGCAEKPYARLFATKAARYVGADLPGNPHADLLLGPDGRVPVDDGSVDCVLSSQVLEHVPDPGSYLSEAHRVLKPGGVLLLSTHGFWRYHPDPADYHRWTRDGLVHDMCRAGFAVERTESILGLGTSALQLLQDALTPRGRWRILAGYVPIFQWVIYLLGRRRSSRDSADACVYIVVGRKSPAGS